MRGSIARAVTAAIALLVGLFVVIGCGSGDAGDTPASTSTSGADKPHIIMVSHAPVADKYWAVMYQGLKQAAADLDLSVEYRGAKQDAQDPNEERRLIEAAIVAKPDGLIVTDPFPRSLDPAINRAVAAGIPTVMVNVAEGSLPRTDVMSIVADDPNSQGVAAGQKMRELGVKKPLFVTIPRGVVPAIDKILDAFSEGYGSAPPQLQIPLDKVADAGFVKNALAAKFEKDSSLDGAFSLGPALTTATIQARKELGSRGAQMRWASLDLGEPVVSALQARAWDFAVDPQQYASPYTAAVILNLYLRYGITPARVVPVAGGLVTPENVGRIVDLQAQNVR